MTKERSQRVAAVWEALVKCKARGHTLINRGDPRYFHFSVRDTNPDDILWMRDNLRALDRFTLRLEARRKAKDYVDTPKKARTFVI